MKAEVQTTKTYHVVLDETEMLEICAELATIDVQDDKRYALHNLHLVLKSLE